MISALFMETSNMKRINHLLVLVFICVSGLSFGQTDSISAVDTVELIPFKGQETVYLGDVVTYTGHVHGSVGEQVSAQILEDGVLRFIDTEIDYEQDQSQGLSGGDGAWKSFVYHATKVGETTITIQEIFRGEIMQERTITINVIARRE
ncbi:MAG: hypothetical protein Crog4KO_10140 [Crocinitomicaceae bacterium]